MTRNRSHKPTFLDRLKEWKEFIGIFVGLGTGLVFTITKIMPFLYLMYTVKGDIGTLKTDVAEMKDKVVRIDKIMTDSMYSRGKMLNRHDSSNIYQDGEIKRLQKDMMDERRHWTGENMWTPQNFTNHQ